MSFVHLNVHSHYSVLQGMCHVAPLVDRCKELEMNTLALTDNANMFACLEFYKACKKQDIKPILGMTCYVIPDMKLHKIQDGIRVGRRLVLLAKDYKGYQTLCRISSYAYMEGFYFKPRVDRALLEQHHDGLVILSGGMGSEVHECIKNGRKDKAEECIKFYKDLVGEDSYFVEIQRTGIEELKDLNAKAENLAKKHNIKCVASNDVYYVEQKDSLSHEILMCIGQQKLLNDASRPRFSTNEFYLKSPKEMAQLFEDRPDLIENTDHVASLCDVQIPEKEYHLPLFEPPEGMSVEEYFDHECRKGLEKRYETPLSDEILSRYEMEKGVIFRTGFPTYFLIVADFIQHSHKMGIPVGPGRGSGAGSIIAYALEITDIDPLRFELLFERFLNEERVSMPDFDIDFCQERRQEVIEYVRDHYGREKVANIATFGTMGAKGVIRDVGRVLGVELREVDRLCKMVPTAPGINLKKAMKENPEFKNEVEGNESNAQLMEHAFILEGTVRNIGTHAAGVVIADKDLKEYLPLYAAEDTVSTQFTMTSVEEDCGLLKMDFLGLQNLTVIKKATDLIEETRGIKLDIRNLPLEDEEVYQLFTRGETVGIFQFESQGMQEWLKKLMPTCIEDLIAMNALYRPGPMDLIPDYIKRKHGTEEVIYPHEMLSEVLGETYGIPVYQEQVMQMAQKMADYSLGGADILRRAMGKKKVSEMDRQRLIFVEGSGKKGVGEEKANEVFDMMAKFAGYGFNKSHAAAYSMVAYQTAFLKTHYPAEFMAALMTCDIRNKDKIAFFREECTRMKIEVLPPHINESAYDFRVVDGRIRYGLGGAKGVGAPAVEAIVEERKEKGAFTSFDEFIERVDLSRCGKSAIESMIKCGAMDGLNANRCQMFEGVTDSMQMAQNEAKKQEQGQMMLFAVENPEPTNMLQELPEWPERDKLAKEKEVLGFYVTSHPLASVQQTLRYFSSHNLLQLRDLEEGAELCIGGIVSQSSHRFYRENKKMYRFHFEDLSHSMDCVYFCPENDRYGPYLEDDQIVFLVGRAGRDRVGEPSIRISRIIPLEDAEKLLSSSIAIHAKEKDVNEKEMRNLSKLLKQYKGKIPVYVLVERESDVMQFKLDSEYDVVLEKSLLEKLSEEYGRESIEIRKYNKSLLGGRRW